MTTAFNVRGKLTVTAHAARNLAVKQLIGEMDPYAVFQLKGEKFKTAVATNAHRNPKWEYSFIANLDGDEDALHIKVYNKGNLTDDVICRVDTELPNLDLSGTPQWYSLRDPEDFKKECGEIQITLKFEGNGLPLNSKALGTHNARTQPTGAVAPFSPQTPQQVQSPQYASQPPQYATQAPQYPQQPMQPMYQQPQQVQYQQPQQVQYQQPQVQFQQAPVYQQQPMQPVYQQQPMYQPPPMQQPQYQPQPVYQAPPPQQSAASGLFGSIMQATTQLASSIQANVNSLMSTASKGKFDSAAYLQIHPDVKNAGMDGFQHWKQYGYKEQRVIQLKNGLRGRFDTNGYLNLHVDVKNANVDAFVHYTSYGHNENRDIVVIPTAAVGVFDATAYHSMHPDVKNAGMDAFQHYKQYGYNERRRVPVINNGNHWQGTFDGPGYLLLWPDVKAANMDPWTHWTSYGKNENRSIVVTL